MKEEKTIINDIEFTCPRCGGHSLSKIMTDVTCWGRVGECHVLDGSWFDDQEVPFLEEVGKAWYECDGCEATFEGHTLAALVRELEGGWTKRNENRRVPKDLYPVDRLLSLLSSSRHWFLSIFQGRSSQETKFVVGIGLFSQN